MCIKALRLPNSKKKTQRYFIIIIVIYPSIQLSDPYIQECPFSQIATHYSLPQGLISEPQFHAIHPLYLDLTSYLALLSTLLYHAQSFLLILRSTLSFYLKLFFLSTQTLFGLPLPHPLPIHTFFLLPFHYFYCFKYPNQLNKCLSTLPDRST